jgi:radical SAM superfamily enzyme YgiQ (UPF0313 family)
MLQLAEKRKQEVPMLATPRHPLGTNAGVLLTSVFGPYAVDDEFGSRIINPMELYHNQVTREQGPFSLRMFHRSWGLMLIQHNMDASCTMLDFPKLDRFVAQIKENQYDIIGIGSIMPNLGKVKHMCQLIRRYQPHATIVVGGHIANMPGLEQIIDADHIVRGDGVRWFREFLGQTTDSPIRHPRILSGLSARTMGIPFKEKQGDVAATLIPSVGCPIGCNFCATSAMFGGKGKYINFYETGDELFDVMCELERELRVKSFFVMDENFLLHRKRALRLLELMQAKDKSWALYVFSSATALRSYRIEQLVALGVSWVWMGLEGNHSQYAKLKGTDTFKLIRTLQENGVRVLGSSIIGMEEHTPENIEEVIEHAVKHDTDFHQFMLYTPVPGTPLWREHQEKGDLLDPEYHEIADSHGQCKFNFMHEHIRDGQEAAFLRQAFVRDFSVNGPSVLRVLRTTLQGWVKHRNHADLRIRRRFEHEARGLGTYGAAALWAARKWYAKMPEIRERLDTTLQLIYKNFGWISRWYAPLAGRYVFRQLRKEGMRLHDGVKVEPTTFCEHEAGRVPATQWQVSPSQAACGEVDQEVATQVQVA